MFFFSSSMIARYAVYARMDE